MTKPWNAAGVEMYQKTQLPNGSIHVVWSLGGIQQATLCGVSNEGAATDDLLRAQVTCRRCADRAMAIIEGKDSPR